MDSTNLVLNFCQGFGVSMGLIVAIGAQNAFVIRQGLKCEHRFIVALVSAILDGILILLGVLGFGILVVSFPIWIKIMTWGGIVYLFIFGLLSFRSALRTKRLEVSRDGKKISIKKILLMTFSFSLLNPHCYLDTVVLIGSVSTNFIGSSKIFFAAGAITSSFVWFFSLVYAASMLAPIFRRPLAWKFLDTTIGVVMWAIALKLLLNS